MADNIICPVCKTRPAMLTSDLRTSWDTCEICTGAAIQAFLTANDISLVMAKIEINLSIGSLDRLLSEFLYLCTRPELDEVDAQTLKHHAEDLIGVGTHALAKLQKRGVS